MDPFLLACIAFVILGLIGITVAKRGSAEPPKPASQAAVRAVPAPQPQTPADDGAHALPHVRIYYGSQTGTAEGFAKQISNDAKRNGFKASVIDLEGFDADAFTLTAVPDNASGFPHIAVFLMATYGEGDPTDNALGFTRWLKVCVQPRYSSACFRVRRQELDYSRAAAIARYSLLILRSNVIAYGFSLVQ